MAELDPYQIQGANWLASGCINGLAALGDDPGLGKSAQAIRALDLLDIRKTLVICPAAVKTVWPYEIKLWGQIPRRVVSIQDDIQIGAWIDGKFDVAVMSYEKASQVSKLLQRTVDYIPGIIIDEGHYLKSRTAKRTKQILGPECDRRYSITGLGAHVFDLSGTFMPNAPIDIWTLLRASGATRASLNNFERQFFDIRWEGAKMIQEVRLSALPELQDMISSVVLRRTKKLLGLKGVRTSELPIDGTSEELKALLREHPGLSQAVKDAAENGGDLGTSFEDTQHIATLRRLTGEAKAPGYAHMLCEEIEGGLDKAIVFCVHKKVVSIVAEVLRSRGIEVVTLTGETKEADRKIAIERFQFGTAQVFIGNIIAAGTGLTLTAAAWVDMLEISWRPADNYQAIARADRKGQTRLVNARFPYLANSVDEHVTGVVRRKVDQILTIDPEAF